MRILFLFLVLLCSCQHNRSSKIITKEFDNPINVQLDSNKLNTVIAPVYWYIDSLNIVIMQIKTDNLITVLDKSSLEVKAEFARQGRGPNEYLSPGLVLGSPTNTISIEQGRPQKYDTYKLLNDSVVLDISRKRALPIDDRIKSVSMPKLYSFINYIDSDLIIGSSFAGAKPEVDIVDINHSKNIYSLDFMFDFNNSHSASPYLFSVDYFNGYFVIAYNYINRVEVYKMVNNGLELQYIIGDDKIQEKLFKEEKYDDMVVYYDAVVLDKEKLYVLYYGVKEGVLYSEQSVVSYIEVYNLADGKPIELYEIPRKVTDMVIDRYDKKLYMIDPAEMESIVFSIDI